MRSLIALLFVALFAGAVRTQSGLTPINDQVPNSYQPGVRNWATHADGRAWGSTAGIDIGPAGEIWAIDRCGANSCDGSNAPTVHQIDPGERQGRSQHRRRAVRVSARPARRSGRQHLGDRRPGEQGRDERASGVEAESGRQGADAAGQGGTEGRRPRHFDEPCDVITAPNGDIFVADGHSGQQATATPATASRIVKFTRAEVHQGVRQVGRGSRASSKRPHAMAIDSRGRLIVADRGNMRIQIYDLDGNFMIRGRSSAASAACSSAQTTRSTRSTRKPRRTITRAGERACASGALKDGKVTHFVPGHQTENPDGAAGEGIAVGANGTIYAAENTLRGITRYLHKYIVRRAHNIVGG